MSYLHEAAESGKVPAVSFTWFERHNNAQGKRGEIEWSDLCSWIAGSTAIAKSKDNLPLLKLATFSGDYRKNDSLEAICGIEGDYDGEVVQPADAAAQLQRAGIAALIYTSPSHRSEAPRWRVLCPLSLPVTPSERHALAARLNGALGGSLARESFTASQPYYVGAVQGGEPVQCWRVDGRCIDLVDGIAPVGPPESPSEPRKALGSELAPSIDAAREALWSIDPNECDYAEWRNVSAAFRQSVTGLADPEAIRIVWDAWCALCEKNSLSDNNKLWKSLDKGTALGWSFLRSRAAPEVWARLAFGADPTAAIVTAIPASRPRELDFWSTFNADDGAKSSAVVCTKYLADSAVPVAHDEFADKLMITARVPWDDATTSYPREWNDNDTHGCKALLEMSFIKPSKDTVFDSVRFVAMRRKYHPVRDYLVGLKWDGTLRLPWLASGYFGAIDTQYGRVISAKYMISAVARIMRPGCKVDTMLILEGEQGRRKSTALRALAGDDWFTDQLPDLTSKDASIQLRGKWLIEFGELDRMNRAEVTAVKSYASRQVDTYRPPYGRSTVDVPRQCVFAGTTNEMEYLRDQTGNRRYWPIACGDIDLDAIRRDRDQLWAEAVHRFDAGEAWWLDDAEEELARAEQDDRRERHPWEQRLADRLSDTRGVPVTMEQACRVLEIPFERQNSATNKLVAASLRAVGFTRRQMRTGDRRAWVYVKDA